jgi:phage shock protein A
MGLMTRFTRLCKADIHGVMDQLEDKPLILKQCLREMETSLCRKQAESDKLRISLEQIRHEQKQYGREREKLERDLTAAIERGKDDIARLLIKKVKTMDQHEEVLDRHGDALERKMALLTEGIETQKRQHAELQLRSETWFQQTAHQKWEKTLNRAFPHTVCTSLTREEVELELIKRKETLKGGA